MAVPREEFAQWKESGVHSEFIKTIHDSISAAAAEIISRTRPDNDRDMYLRGLIEGMTLMAEWVPELTEEDE